jgi:O-methyltransferase
VDCGVWKGGSTVLLSAGAPRRDVWAFDSFAGLPDPGPDDDEAETRGRGGDLVVGEACVRDAFQRYADPERLHVRKGWFHETLPVAAEEIGSIAVLHCDGDWYESVRITLEALYPLISSGGFVVVDDYGHYAGARKAVDAYRRDHDITAPVVDIDGIAGYWRR